MGHGLRSRSIRRAASPLRARARTAFGHSALTMLGFSTHYMAIV